MSKITFNMNFEKHVPKSGLPISAQRKAWFKEFMKPYVSVVLIYSAVYLIRDNFKAAQPLLKQQMGMTTEQLGLIGFAFSLAYGLGKIIVGYLVTGKDEKKSASIMLLGASIIVFAVGVVLSVNRSPMGWILALWALNGIFQCSSGPCCTGTIVNWTTKKNYGRYYSIWSTSHNIGGGLAGVFSLWCAQTFFGGHVAGMFIAPALVAVVIAVFGFFFGKDRPEDLGWETTEKIFGEPPREEDTTSTNDTTWQLFRKYLLGNPWIWILCCSDVFAYIVRVGIDNWSSLRVTEQLHFSTQIGAQAIFYFGMGSLIGSVIWGMLSDLLGGRPAMMSLICLVITPIPLAFYQFSTTPMMMLVAIFLLGIFVFGPQVLISISILTQVPRKAAALAGGMLGAFAYLLGDSTAKVLLARIADSKAAGLNIFGTVLHGWGDTFSVLYVAIFGAIVLQALVTIHEEKKIRRAKKLAELEK